MIPKIIHYCWLSDDPIPARFQEYFASWQRVLSDYEFIKWDFFRFDKKKSCWVSEAFDNKKYAFAADYIRLFAVYNYGGIYLDMDIEVLKSFDDLLNSEYMFALERSNAPWIEAGCFGAEKGNTFLLKCLEYYEGRHFIKPDGSFDMETLPRIMERIKRENHFDLKLYNSQYFTAKSFITGIESPSDETYCIHHFAGSWKTADEQKELILSRKYSKVLGWWLGRNIAQYQIAIKRDGIKAIVTLTKEKLLKKASKNMK